MRDSKGRFLKGHKIHKAALPLKERFWNKVAVTGPDDCWEWRASKYPGGYGKFKLYTKAQLSAHRVAWLFDNPDKSIPAGMCVCHRCNNKGCCNPSHLYLATQQQNTHDAYIDGLLPTGERHGSAKLNDAIVLEIRQLFATGRIDQYQLADKYGVGQAVISAAIRGVTWKHVEMPDIPKHLLGKGAGRRRRP